MRVPFRQEDHLPVVPAIRTKLLEKERRPSRTTIIAEATRPIFYLSPFLSAAYTPNLIALLVIRFTIWEVFRSTSWSWKLADSRSWITESTMAA
jgi:hypothetical protein